MNLTNKKDKNGSNILGKKITRLLIKIYSG